MTKKLKWEPALWSQQLENIELMRKNRDAPVDLMGCESLSKIDPMLSEKDKRYNVLLSLMLSSQTKDEITAKAMENLRTSIQPLTVDNVLSKTEEEIGKMIYPVGFWKTKAKHILKTTQMLKDKHDCDIPDSIEGLCALAGVGPKMAYITMSVAWKRNVGIGVDVHVHRIANRLEWTRKATKTPEQTRKELEDWLPCAYWDSVNKLLVGFGQQICKPVKPNCSQCLNQTICPFALKKK